MSTEPVGPPRRAAKRLTLYVEYRDQVRHRPIVFEILERARHAPVAGMTVFQGRVGYGASGRLHRSHLLTDDSPQAIVIVDAPDRIDDFLRSIDDLLVDVLVVVDDVEIVET